MKLEVTVDIRDVGRYLDLSHKQVRYAAARALTDMAQFSQAQVVSEMPGRFTMRRKWITKGIRISRATRKELRAEVFSIDRYMGRQEGGGDKTPVSGRHVAVPGPVLRPGGASKDARKIPLGEWPKASLTKERTFLTRTKSGAMVIMRRNKGTQRAVRIFGGRLARALYGRKYGRVRGRGRILKRSARIVYTLVGRAHVKPRLGMVDAVNKIVKEEFRLMFMQRFAEAQATARVDP